MRKLSEILTTPSPYMPVERDPGMKEVTIQLNSKGELKVKYEKGLLSEMDVLAIVVTASKILQKHLEGPGRQQAVDPKTIARLKGK